MHRCREVAGRRACFADSSEEVGTQPSLPGERRALEGDGRGWSVSDGCDSVSSANTPRACPP